MATLVALVLFLAAVSQGTSLARVQPALQELAAAQPAATVRVIVQHAPASDVEAAVNAAGGRVVRELNIIKATVAELPAAAVEALARLEGVRWISLDGPVNGSDKPDGNRGKGPNKPGTTPDPLAPNTYLDTLNVRPVWAMGIDGSGVAVAIIDSGLSNEADFRRRIAARQKFVDADISNSDRYGHGTHIAGIIGGDGAESDGVYRGIAPGVDLIGLKVTDVNGMAYESDTVAAMEWVLQNKERYNIRVVNLSFNGVVEQSYHTSPIDAAAEILWFNNIVVVASAGNGGGSAVNTIRTAPANDPFVITVGATFEGGTPNRGDDGITGYSAAGKTLEGYAKPELYAPGTDIISVFSRNSPWAAAHPERAITVGNKVEYFRLSGTSMSAPMVAGAAALLLQDEPHLNPDQVKYRLQQTAGSVGGEAGYLDVYAAVTGSSRETANTGTPISQLLLSGAERAQWGSVNWGSVNWGSVNWGSVNWGSVNWGSVNWGSVNWGSSF